MAWKTYVEARIEKAAAAATRVVAGVLALRVGWRVLLLLAALSFSGCASQAPAMCYDPVSMNRDKGTGLVFDHCRGLFIEVPLVTVVPEPKPPQVES